MRKLTLIILLVTIFSCSTTDKVKFAESSQDYISGEKVLVVKSEQIPIENLPDSITVKTMHILLAESIVTNCELELLNNRDINTYNSLLESNTLLDELSSQTNYITTVSILDFYSPSFSLSGLTASSKTKQLIVEIELRILDLNTREEIVSTIKSSVKQKAKSVVFTSDMDKTTGKESAVAVAIERGIDKLVMETFKKR